MSTNLSARSFSFLRENVILSIGGVVDLLTSLDVLESVGTGFEKDCGCLSREERAGEFSRRKRQNRLSAYIPTISILTVTPE